MSPARLVDQALAPIAFDQDECPFGSALMISTFSWLSRHFLAQKHLLYWLLACLVLTGCSDESGLVVITGPTMGTTWSLRGAGMTEISRALVQDHLDQRESVLSHWKPDSAISRFNNSPSTDWFSVPAELIKAVELAHQIAEETDGVLDVTIAPLVEAWGFAGHAASVVKPGLENVGWQHLQWRDQPPALKKNQPQVRINVGAVTEGLLMDELILKLKAEGLTDFLLEIGGEVAAIGHAPDGKPWQVGLQAPDGAKGESLEALSLTDTCISTSGSYRHRFEKDGKTYSHLIDPRTGRPIEHHLVSVSVIHPKCSLADGYATAFMILGPKKGREVAQRLGLRVIWLEEP
jgi:FAD:protein FMN transferase